MPTATHRTAQSTSARQEKWLRLGQLAASAGLTAAQLECLAEARRLRSFAAAMQDDNDAFADWLSRGAPVDDAPDPEAALNRWRAEFERPQRVKARATA